MLVLSRGKDEQVIIRMPTGETIKVGIGKIHGNRVRLYFEAPAAITIHRQEVWDRLHGDDGGEHGSDIDRR